jgi:type IV secretion system protein VirD4
LKSNEIPVLQKPVSGSLDTATEMRAVRNYAGHEPAPWLSHLMVSGSEPARPLLTPGEVVMQFTPDSEIVMAAGIPPTPAKKARYFEDARSGIACCPCRRTRMPVSCE